MMIKIALVLHALWVVGVTVALMSWHRLRDIGNTPTVPLAQARPGMEARVVGRADFHGAERKSPIGAEPAVWSYWLIERDYDSMRDLGPRGQRFALATESSTEPFALVDETGNIILVWPARAEVIDPQEMRWDHAYPATIDGTLHDRLLRGENLAAPLTNTEILHFTERWLAAGETCFVMGRVEAPGPEHGPGVRGVIREGGDRDFLISRGEPVDTQDSLRRQLKYAVLGTLAAFALAILATILA